MKRLWLMSTVLLTLGLVMLGCVAPAPPAQAPAPEEEAPKAPEEAKAKITWSFWGSPDEVAAHEDALEAFRKAHPEIEVEIMHIEWADYFTKMETLFAAGKPEDIPDVMFVGGPWTQKWASLGVLEPLNSFIERDNVDLDDYWPKLLAYGSIGDQIYGLSRDVPPNVLYYNKAIFQEAGVDFPDETWTWEGFLAAAEKLTVKDASGRVSRYALGMEQGKYWYWLAQAGGSIVDDAEHNFSNPSKCMLDSPESQHGIEFMNELYRKGYLMPNADMEAQGRDRGVFIADQVAMIIQNASRVSAFVEAEKDFDIAPLPVPSGGQRANGTGGAIWGISAQSDAKEAAWTFVKWLQAADGGQPIYTASGQIVPALKSVAASSVFQEVLPINTSALVVEAEAGGYVGNPLFPEWADIRGTIVQPNLERIWTGEATPDEVLSELCAQVNAALEEAGYPK